MYRLRPVLVHTKIPGPCVAAGHCKAKTPLGFREKGQAVSGALVGGRSCDLYAGTGMRVVELAATTATSSTDSDSIAGGRYGII